MCGRLFEEKAHECGLLKSRADLALRNVTDELGVLGLAGPFSRQLLVLTRRVPSVCNKRKCKLYYSYTTRITRTHIRVLERYNCTRIRMSIEFDIDTSTLVCRSQAQAAALADGVAAGGRR